MVQSATLAKCSRPTTAATRLASYGDMTSFRTDMSSAPASPSPSRHGAPTTSIALSRMRTVSSDRAGSSLVFPVNGLVRRRTTNSSSSNRSQPSHAAS